MLLIEEELVNRERLLVDIASGPTDSTIESIRSASLILNPPSFLEIHQRHNKDRISGKVI